MEYVERMKRLTDVSTSGQAAQGDHGRRSGARNEMPDTCQVDVVHLDAVKRARAALPDEAAATRVADLLALLSNPTRLRILFALQPKAAPALPELCVCDLAFVAGVSKSLTSHQLRLLRMAGLVLVRRAGKLAYYRLANGPRAVLLRDVLDAAHSDESGMGDVGARRGRTSGAAAPRR